MKKKAILSLILAMAVLSGCNSAKDTKSTKNKDYDTDETVVTTDETDDTTTTDVTTTETSDDDPGPVSEPMAYSVTKEDHDAGVVKDGVYFASNIVFDEDDNVIKSDIYEYVQFDERTMDFMDTAYFLDIEDCCYGNDVNGSMTVKTVNTYVTRSCTYGEKIVELNNEGWYLKLQGDGNYYMFDQYDIPLLFPYEEQINLSVGEEPVIYAYADVFSEDGIKTYDFTYEFDSFQSFKETIDAASLNSINYNAHIVVEDGVIKEICIVPVMVKGNVVYAHNTEHEEGKIPDGDYCCDRYSFDEDMKGMTLDIRDYTYFTQEEIDSLEKWDSLVILASKDKYNYATDQSMDFSMITVINDPSVDGYIMLDNDWFLSQQSDGTYYVDWDGLVNSSAFEKDVHLDVSDSVVIMDKANVYSKDGIVTYDYTDVYDDLKSFAEELESDTTWYIPNIHIVVESGEIVGIYINPDQHQPWKE